MIQAKQLRHDVKTELERVLSVFGQEEFIDPKGHKIDFPEGNKKNDLLQKNTTSAFKGEIFHLAVEALMATGLTEEDAHNRLGKN